MKTHEPEQSGLLSRVSPLALLAVVICVALLVPLQRKLRSAPDIAAAEAGASQQYAENVAAARARHAQTAAAEETATSGTADHSAFDLQTVAATRSGRSFGRDSGVECNEWTPVFVAETQASGGFGVLGVDTSQPAYESARARRYTRVVESVTRYRAVYSY